MPRKMTLLIAALGLSFAAMPVSADNIGVGKPGTETESSSQSTTITTEDNIGVGNESWFDMFTSWFETSGS